MTETSCAYITNTQLDGKKTNVLQTVHQSKCSRLQASIPLNTLVIAAQLDEPYLQTLHHLKQLEIEGLVTRVDYYPNPFAVLVTSFPLSLQWLWLQRCQSRIYDPATGETRPRSPREFALWVAT